MTAADIIRVKKLLPTSLGSDEVREAFAKDILRRSIFSARMESLPYLAKVREVCAAFADGEINSATARDRLGGLLARMGFSPQDGERMDNPASEMRLNLIVKTNAEMAANVARLSNQTEAVVNLYPGWSLTRVGSRMMPRKDWLSRWNSAGASVGWEGARQSPTYGDGTSFSFLALKSSPIWQALGDGAGGFRDTLGNPYPPFAFGSGMDWEDASRATCVRFGLVGESERLPALPGAASLAPKSGEIDEALAKFDFIDFKDLAA